MKQISKQDISYSLNSMNNNDMIFSITKTKSKTKYLLLMMWLLKLVEFVSNMIHHKINTTRLLTKITELQNKNKIIITKNRR